jgi:hypothetical protein
VLEVDVDWAEEFHDMALGPVEEGVVEQFRIEPLRQGRLPRRPPAHGSTEPDPISSESRRLRFSHRPTS